MIENLLVNAGDTGNAGSTSESGRCPGEGGRHDCRDLAFAQGDLVFTVNPLVCNQF